MLNQPSAYVDNQQVTMRLPRSLSTIETWGFGVTGHVTWIVNAPVIHAALGSQALLVWLPGVIVSILLNLQLKSLGRHFPDVAGGTPNYAARLLKDFPILGRYVAIAYFFAWAAAPALYAIILTELIETNLTPLGISCPKTLLKIGFTAIAFIVALSGSRALAILHLFFVIPAIAFLLAFCLQGMGWLISTPKAITFTSLHSLSFREWAKWFFIASYSVYACETTSSFVADSRHPNATLQFLTVAAWLIPPVFLGGSFVLTYLDSYSGSGENTFLHLLATAQPFWGQSASFLVTLLISFSCLLSCATSVANSPRILYQLALDKQLSPVFAVVSRQGVLAPALIFTFLLSLVCLVWGNLSQILMVTGTSYLVSIMGLHLSLWLRRDRPEVRWGSWSLCFFIMEVAVLVVGGIAWSWGDLLIGLFFPIVILVGDAAIRRISFKPFHPQWWHQRYSKGDYQPWESKFKDFVVAEVILLIVLVCSATAISWVLSNKLNSSANEHSANLLAILQVTLSFVAIAIACWTTLPQITAIDEARSQAKSILKATFDSVPDAILVLDKNGKIIQANLAAEALLEINFQELIGYQLNQFFSNLAGTPQQWDTCSEQILDNYHNLRTVELTISQAYNRQLQEYIAIARDITKRKQAEAEIRNALEKEKQLSELKSRFVTMASHEFRTPLTTILSSAELLEEYANKWTQERKLKHFQRIQTSVKHITQLLNDVLLIGKAEAGKLEYNPATLDLGQFCYDLVEEMQLTADKHTISFISQGNCTNAYLDAKLLRHILGNLLSNAIKYSPTGGTVDFKLNYQSEELIFRIQDQGIGIPVTDLPQLFDSFHRASNVGTISGTGLGLAIVKKAVDLQQGQIIVESEVGVGTTFIVSLPLKQAKGQGQT